ncbi:unnamed protein product [Larinioides sclopetarius]|uniref:Uncharacterized protein n=1 Tax=Larinioides sclopetarius TaxID=280406 RepID=A0AAV2AXB0_9ARAC
MLGRRTPPPPRQRNPGIVRTALDSVTEFPLGWDRGIVTPVFWIVGLQRMKDSLIEDPVSFAWLTQWHVGSELVCECVTRKQSRCCPAQIRKSISIQTFRNHAQVSDSNSVKRVEELALVSKTSYSTWTRNVARQRNTGVEAWPQLPFVHK